MLNSKYNLIARIKQEIPILEAARRYLPTLQLRQQGRKYVGCCPFHQEKTGSFYIWPETGRFKCFGCQVSGDVIEMAQLALNLSLKDAIHLLATDCGISKKLDTKARRQAVKEIRQAKNESLITNTFQAELDRILIELGRIESALYYRLKTAKDYLKHPGAIYWQPIVTGLLEEILSFEPARQLWAWRFIRRQLPWILK